MRLFDGDILRKGLCEDLRFSKKDRLENIRRVGEVAKLFLNSGFFVIVSIISPFKSGRDKIRNSIGNKKFVEIYLECPLIVCEKRDTKGLYKKAREGKIKEFIDLARSPDGVEIIKKAGFFMHTGEGIGGMQGMEMKK